jgi:hypothetical protein
MLDMASNFSGNAAGCAIMYTKEDKADGADNHDDRGEYTILPMKKRPVGRRAAE